MRHLLLLTALFAIVFSVGCSTNEATGRRQFNTLSSDQEIAMGEQAMPQLIQEYGGEVQSPELRAYVTRIGKRLAKQTEGDLPNLPWEFTVLDSPVINAFALPGGKVFISVGLLSRFENEAQLAGVLGHEVGHVTAQHIDERISQTKGIEILGQIATAAIGNESAWAQAVPLVVGVGGQGYLLKFGRGQESESDTLGMRYMVEAGYDPRGMLGVMEILAEASQGKKQPEFLSTHPYPETRIKTINNLLKGKYAYTQNNPDFRTYPGRFEREAMPYMTTPTP